jgi:uncharacterized protein
MGMFDHPTDPMPEAPDMRGAKPPPAAAPSIEVAYALPDRQQVVTLPLPPEGCTVGQAVERSGLLEQFPQIAEGSPVFGIFGAVCREDRPLRDGDRVEIYRPLKFDPKIVRRQRAAQRKRGR